MIRTFIALLMLSGAYAPAVILEVPEDNLSVPENIPSTVEDTLSPPNDPDFTSRVSVELEEFIHPSNNSEDVDLKTDATFWWPYYRPFYNYPRHFRYYRPRPYYRRHFYG